MSGTDTKPADTDEATSPDGLTIRSSSADGATIVALGGRVCDGDGARFAKSFDRMLAGGARAFVLDCAGLSYADSTLIAEFVVAFRRARARGGRVLLAAPPDSRVRHILKITALDRVLEVFADADEALARLGGRDRKARGGPAAPKRPDPAP